ncbi:TRAF-interacting protein with FHA domain-containing protein A [Echinops telfairi]|uniref:TRAF-interacting protein with FHA domain-containing protein A n=1 Tax=Echinops telfairi TaxID=9371 RepID=A0ABM0IME0_ECHTE|nr:TRAF-interacting protein with FHA domain-containing protein A [Echinops telfairi]
MSSFEDADTEETLTCLQITLYHPDRLQAGRFQSLRFCHREKLPSHKVVNFGRHSSSCHYVFQDKQVSRIQFSLQLFRDFSSSVLSVEIKNMSQKTSLFVDNHELGYLNKVKLPPKCILRFGDYQCLVEKEDGESLTFFETQFAWSPTSLLEENLRPLRTPVPENGSHSTLGSTLPTEMDENEL